jgi:hypothetical protein
VLWLKQARVEIAQSFCSLEHHVGEVLGLRCHPVVPAAVQCIIGQWHHLPAYRFKVCGEFRTSAAAVWSTRSAQMGGCARRYTC